jgi:hypothetical protein
MNHSESIKNIGAALATFQVKAEKIIKTAENPFFHSKYADLPSILDAIALPLAEAGLVVSQWPDGEGLTTILIHPDSGEYITANGIMKPVKNDPQSMGSAITYQRRYSLCAVLGLNVDSDDDGNEASKPAETKAVPDKPWLNKNTPEFEQARAFYQKSTDKAAAINALRAKFAISTATLQALK